MPERTTDEIFQRAVQHHQAGRIDGCGNASTARSCSNRPIMPTHLYGLGIIHASRNEHDSAIALIHRSIELHPTPATLAGLGTRARTDRTR